MKPLEPSSGPHSVSGPWMLHKVSPACQPAGTIGCGEQARAGLFSESPCLAVYTQATQASVWSGTGAGRAGEAQCPPSASHCFNGSRGENKDFMAVTNISSHTFYSPQLLRMLGSCRSWKIHKTHVNFYVQLF